MPPSATLTLTRKRKAAIIVQMIVGQGDKLSLSHLPMAVQEALAEELGLLRLVDKTTVNAVAAEFLAELGEIGMIAPFGQENVLKTLGDRISPDLASKMRTAIANTRMSDPWSMLIALPIPDLLPIMLEQSTQIAAVVLSKLSVASAAEVLGKLPGERARRITYAVSQTASISPDAVRRIGAALVQEYCTSQSHAFEKAPVQRVGAILNFSPATTRDDMLAGLTDEDPEFASDVRRAIFTFADITTRIVPTDIAACIRSVPPDTLTTAIGGALAAGGDLAEAAEFILGNISQRMAGQMREDVAERGAIKPAEVDQAMNAVTAAVRELTDAGTIKLIVIETEDD